MKKSVDLLARADAEIKKAEALNALADEEGRDLTSQELGQIKAFIAESDRFRELAAVEDRLHEERHRRDAESIRTAPAQVTDLAAERPWAGPGEFFSAVRSAHMPGGLADVRLMAAATGMSQGIPSEGGFTCPIEISTAIWNGIGGDPSALLPLTDSYTVTGESISFNANAETSRVQGSLYGGVRAYWVSEAAQITGSKPKFRQARVEPQGMAALVYATDKLLMNSDQALGQYLTRCASGAITHTINQAIISGDGAGKPLGILNSGALVSVAKETNQAAATILQENISKMWARLHPAARANAIWLHNTDAEPALDTLSTVVKNVAGTENVGGYANKVFDPERRTLKGRPLMVCEWCETLGTVGDLILWDPKSYLTGTKGGVKEDMSIHVRFEYAETAFRFMFYVDGQPWLASALTPAKGSNTLTSHVALATRS